MSQEKFESSMFGLHQHPKVREMLGLGLLGDWAASPAEPFRNAVTKSQIRSCMSKLFDVQADLERQAKREKTSVRDGFALVMDSFSHSLSAIAE